VEVKNNTSSIAKTFSKKNSNTLLKLPIIISIVFTEEAL
jgi:hypothetical protein